MKILVTGSAGYVGKPTCQLLAEAGHQVITFDRPRQDLLSRAALLRVFNYHRIDAVIHLAALCNVSESVGEPDRYWAVNVQGTVNLLDCMLSGGCPRLVFASTLAAGQGFIPGIPCHTYGWTKRMAENAVRDYCRHFRFSAFILRYTNVAGGKHESQTHLVPSYVRAAKKREPFKITAPLDTIRDIIHVDDVAAANANFVAHLPNLEESECHTLDIGTGIGWKLADILRVGDIVAHRQLGYVPEREQGDLRPDPPCLIAAPEPASKWGFIATRDLEAVFQSAIGGRKRRASR